MKFAHIRVSEYFTFAEQIFHSEAVSLARRANFTEKSHPLMRMAFFLAHSYKIDPYHKFFRNRYVFLSQRIDLSLGDDELQKSPEKEISQLCRQTKLCTAILLNKKRQDNYRHS